MNTRTKNKPSQEQIDAIIKKYSEKEKVLDLLYTGPSNTPMRLQCCLERGVTLNSLAYGINDYIFLPEYKNGNLPSNTLIAWKNQMNIVKIIFQNFINSNPNYFRKVSVTKYAVSDEFILDVLLHNKNKGFDATDIQSIFPYIVNFDIFKQIVETFYLPYNKKNDTFDTVKRNFGKCKPYKYKKQVGNKKCLKSR